MLPVGAWVNVVRVETTLPETYTREAQQRKRAIELKADREIDSTDTWMFCDGGSKGWYSLVVLRPGEDARVQAGEVRTDSRNVGAEMGGLLKAIEASVRGERVVVVSDFLWSIYYLLGWHDMKNELLRGQVVAGRGLLDERQPASLRFIHVKGHLRDATTLGHWNDVADRVCALGRPLDRVVPRSAFGAPGARLSNALFARLFAEAPAP
jgi:hypothetical protein